MTSAVPAGLRSRRALWIGVPAAVVVAGGATAAVLFATADGAVRGAASAPLAASRFVSAINAGDGDAAAGLACDSFADDARSAAASGRDPGISFVLDSVRGEGADAGTAEITQRLDVAGTTQQQPYLVHLTRTSGRWLVCGRL